LYAVAVSVQESEVRAFWLYAVAVSVQESEVRAFWLYAVAVSVQESEVRAFWLYAVAVSVQESEVRAFWLCAIAVKFPFASEVRAYGLFAVLKAASTTASGPRAFDLSGNRGSNPGERGPTNGNWEQRVTNNLVLRGRTRIHGPRLHPTTPPPGDRRYAGLGPRGL
ncbi:MAG: hypothetical protein V5A24_08215, partial [Haloarculaceae archaeon]